MQKIRKEKVNEAIELLLQSKKDRSVNRIEAAEEKTLGNISTQCKTVHLHKRNRRQYSLPPFSKQVILSEMKSHVTHRDWNKVRNLFLLLLHCSKDIEPLIWRYGLILSMYGNIDNVSNISQFFQMCVGSSHSDRDVILKNLLSLSHHK